MPNLKNLIITVTEITRKFYSGNINPLYFPPARRNFKKSGLIPCLRRKEGTTVRNVSFLGLRFWAGLLYLFT